MEEHSLVGKITLDFKIKKNAGTFYEPTSQKNRNKGDDVALPAEQAIYTWCRVSQTVVHVGYSLFIRCLSALYPLFSRCLSAVYPPFIRGFSVVYSAAYP